MLNILSFALFYRKNLFAFNIYNNCNNIIYYKKMDNSLSKIKKPRKYKEDIEFVLLDDNKNDEVIKEKKVIVKPEKHNINPNIEFVLLNEPQINSDKVVLTEDLGKIFEMSICLLYNTPFDGAFKYSMNDAEELVKRLNGLKEVFPHNLKHIAKNGNKYDFVSSTDDSIYLSAKTTKKDGKVCPQVIGQPSKKKFCEYFGIISELKNDTNNIIYDLEQIKKYIETNIKTMLQIYCENTFDCPIIYYNKHKNKLLFIKLKENIDWSKYNIIFSRTTSSGDWNESSSIKIEGNKSSFGEFQVHNNRDCIKFRWAFENLLVLFKDNFEIINL